MKDGTIFANLGDPKNCLCLVLSWCVLPVGDFSVVIQFVNWQQQEPGPINRIFAAFWQAYLPFRSLESLGGVKPTAEWLLCSNYLH